MLKLTLMGTISIESRDTSQAYTEKTIAENWPIDPETGLHHLSWGGTNLKGEQIEAPNVIFHTPLREKTNIAYVFTRRGVRSFLPGQNANVVLPDGSKDNFTHHS